MQQTDTALMQQLYAFVENDLEKEVEDLVKQNDLNINACSYQGNNTLLVVAAKCDAGKVVRKLIELGADVNAVSQDGMTALMHAGYENRVEAAMALVEEGADLVAPQNEQDWEEIAFPLNVVKAIVDREVRLKVPAASLDAVSQTAHEPQKPGEGWIYTFLTENGIPNADAKICEKRLLANGFYSPNLLARVDHSLFNRHYLGMICVDGLGLQQLLVDLHSELRTSFFALQRAGQGKRLWPQGLDEEENKKRAHI